MVARVGKATYPSKDEAPKGISRNGRTGACKDDSLVWFVFARTNLVEGIYGSLVLAFVEAVIREALLVDSEVSLRRG